MVRRKNILRILLFVVAVVSACQVQKKVGAQPAPATVCGIFGNPGDYDGKTVRVSAVLVSGFEFTVLRDSERRCTDIWVANSAGISNPELEQLAKYSNARLKNKKHPSDYAPPRYTIAATFIGRIQYTHQSGFMIDSKQHIAGIKGRFGHLGQHNTQVFLTSVSNLRVFDLLGSVYKSSEYEPAE
jgi:hypothetical protein